MGNNKVELKVGDLVMFSRDKIVSLYGHNAWNLCQEYSVLMIIETEVCTRSTHQQIWWACDSKTNDMVTVIIDEVDIIAEI